MAFVRTKCCKKYNKLAVSEFSMSPMQLRNAAGFSLMEVLVSILVLAIGVIGAAGMQLAAARTTHQSELQTVALQLASEMSDKIRANDVQGNTQSGGLYLSVDYRSATQGEPPMPGKLCYGANCRSEELAEFDIYEWEKRVKAMLPGGRAKICRDARPWDQSVRSLAWECTANGVGGAGSLVIKLGWQGKNPDGSLVRNAGDEFPPSIAMTVIPYPG